MAKPDRLWDWLAWWYDRHAVRDEALTRAVDRLARLLGEEDRVLDFGCGSGVVACRIAPDVGEVHGIDTSRWMIELAVERARERCLDNVRFSQTSLVDEGLAPTSFDVVVAFHVLHLVEDPGAAVRRISQLLRPGGLLISVTPAGEPGRVLRAVLALVPRLGLLSYLRQYRVSELLDLQRGGGLTIVESELFEGAVQTCFAVARKPDGS